MATETPAIKFWYTIIIYRGRAPKCPSKIPTPFPWECTPKIVTFYTLGRCHSGGWGPVPTQVIIQWHVHHRNKNSAVIVRSQLNLQVYMTKTITTSRIIRYHRLKQEALINLGQLYLTVCPPPPPPSPPFCLRVHKSMQEKNDTANLRSKLVATKHRELMHSFSKIDNVFCVSMLHTCLASTQSHLELNQPLAEGVEGQMSFILPKQ